CQSRGGPGCVLAVPGGSVRRPPRRGPPPAAGPAQRCARTHTRRIRPGPASGPGRGSLLGELERGEVGHLAAAQGRRELPAAQARGQVRHLLLAAALLAAALPLGGLLRLLLLGLERVAAALLALLGLLRLGLGLLPVAPHARHPRHAGHPAVL